MALRQVITVRYFGHSFGQNSPVSQTAAGAIRVVDNIDCSLVVKISAVKLMGTYVLACFGLMVTSVGTWGLIEESDSIVEAIVGVVLEVRAVAGSAQLAR